MLRAVVFHGLGGSPGSVGWLSRILRSWGAEVETPDASGEVVEVAERFSRGGYDVYAGHSRGGSIAFIASALAGRGAVISVASPADRLLQARWLSLSPPGSVQRSLHEDLVRRLGDPWEAPEPYVRSSVLHFLKNVRGPVLIIHGLEDQIVRPYHAEILEDFLRMLGVPVEKLVLEGMAHAPGPRHIEVISRKIGEFLRRLGSPRGGDF